MVKENKNKLQLLSCSVMYKINPNWGWYWTDHLSLPLGEESKQKSKGDNQLISNEGQIESQSEHTHPLSLKFALFELKLLREIPVFLYT